MDDYANLEIGLHQGREDEYRVEFRLSLPNSEAEMRERSNKPIEARFNLGILRGLSDDPEEYGKILTGMLFADPILRVTYASARSKAFDEGKVLRLRLFIGPTAAALHSIRWELLQDPETGAPMATDENIIFSRYLASMDDRPVRLKQKGNLRGLVFVASPTKLPEIKVTDEVELARQGMKGIALRCLPDPDAPAGPHVRGTLENLLNALRDDPEIDILYLACHGTVVDDLPYLFLEDADGNQDRVSGSELVLRLHQIQVQPRLVVLLSCQSAGRGTGDALSALGPRLADIGIPAVVAMQHDFSMDTARQFLPKFFEELQRNGQIDVAMAAARGAVVDEHDSWVPVLFMRLKSGRLWYQPGFTEKGKAKQRMPSIWMNIKKKKLTPILGSGLTEPVLGSLREIAQRWANHFAYPMRPHDRESLPQVAQFLSINQQAAFPFDNLEESLKQHLRETWLPGVSDQIPLNQMIEMVVAPRWTEGSKEPHQFLARLDLPIFITANQDHLLEAALCLEKKTPRTVLCPWNDDIVQPDISDLSTLEGDPLSSENPIVFHLFGSWDQADSVVVTEDQYFQFLLRLSADKDTIPTPIREALVNSGLLFLGFQIDEWAFRVIFHSLLSLPGASLRGKYAHIAAQMEMEDERIMEPAMARQYLEQYFNQGANIDVYWGNPEEFIQEMASHQR